MGYTDLTIEGSDSASDLNSDIRDELRHDRSPDDVCQGLIELLRECNGVGGFNTPDSINVPLVVVEQAGALLPAKLFPELLVRCKTALDKMQKSYEASPDEDFGSVEGKKEHLNELADIQQDIADLIERNPLTGEMTPEPPPPRRIKKAVIYAKCSDRCSVQLYSQEGRLIAERNNYPPPSLKFGSDEIAFEVDLTTGKILNWMPPTDDELLADFGIEELPEDNEE